MTYPQQQYPPQQGYPAPPQQQPMPQGYPAPQGFGQVPAGPQQFAAPAQTAGGDMLKPENINGHLLVVVPHEFLTNINTSQGPSDAIRVNVIDLDMQGNDGQPGRTFRDVLWFPKVLRNGLHRQLVEQGRVPVLATMGRGTQRGSNSPPWILQDMTGNEQAVGRAQAFFARRPQWETEPSDESARAAAAAQQATGPHQWPAGAQPAQQYGPPQGYPQQQPAYAPAAPQPGAPIYGPPQGQPAGYPPAPAPPGYGPPQQYAPAPAAQQGSPEVNALYAQMGAPQGQPQYPQQ